MGVLSGIIGGFERRSDETSTLANPASWLWAILTGGGGPTVAGVTINEHTALHISAVWACIRAISEDAPKAPLEVLRELSPTESEPVPDHPLNQLLNVAPNDEMDGYIFRETLTGHILGWGNAYAEIERDGGGRPVALWPLLPNQVRVRRVWDTDDPRGRIVYDHTSERRIVTAVRAEDILHIRGFGFDGLVGYSPIRMARTSLGLTMAAEKFGAAFFQNAARPGGVLSHPARLSDQAMARLKASRAEMYGGPENTGKDMVLEEGMTWNKITIDPEEAQFLETRQFQPVEVCRWFRMPPHKIADLSRATFSNIEHQSLNYADDTLSGYWTRWEREGRRKLFSLGELASRFKLEHDESELRRGDLESRYKSYALGRQWGFLSVNDILRMEGRRPLPPELGNVYLVPTNMTTPDLLPLFAKAGKPGQAAEDKEQKSARSAIIAAAVVAAFAPAIEHQLRSCLKIECDRARRAAAKGELRHWAGSFFADHHDEVRGRLFPTVEALVGAVAAATELRLDVAACVGEIAKAHCEQSRTALEAINAADLEATLRGWEGARAELDAASHVRRLAVRTEQALTGTVRT